MKAEVVIGACFGDEGKGLVTDYLSDENTVVVRFNGGSQASHTVVTPEGLRHVFSHIGSGTYRGASTFLSRHFIINPYEFQHEIMELFNEKIFGIKIYIDRQALITTPYDMMINQMVEESRDNNRHGSCGVGINETVTRSERFKALRYGVNTLYEVFQYLKIIHDEWVPMRCKELGIEITEEWQKRFDNKDIISDWGAAIVLMDKLTHPVNSLNDVITPNTKVVFEGAQGLMLDQNHINYPYVTRSNTGLLNVVDLIDDVSIDSLSVNYVTRSYMTRHGAGPFATEDKHMYYEDNTNVPNEWQKSIRFGALDLPVISDEIKRDLLWVKNGKIPYNTNLFVTHIDQQVISKYELIKSMPYIDQFYFSNGPTREYVHEIP